MKRTIALFAAIAATLFGQQTPQLEIIPYKNGTPGSLRFYENRANGRNFSGFQARALMTTNCIWELSNLGLIPCAANSQTVGDPSFPLSHLYSAAATISGSGSALSITGSTSGSALNITGTGGGRAYSFYSTQRMLAGTDGYYVTPDGFTQNVVIDTTRNATLNGVTAAATIFANSASSPAISVPNATAFNALNIGNGGGAALTWFATNALNTTGTINVGATIGTLSTVIDNAKNGTFAALSATGTITSTSASSPAISVPNATAFNAINVQNGGVAALTLFGTNALNTIGTINVGPNIVSLATVIDNAGNLSPYSNYGSSQGSTSKRYDIHYGRFLNLRTNGAAIAGVTARDNSNNITFTMGDGGGTGGEFLFYTSGLTEYFGAINGQVR